MAKKRNLSSVDHHIFKDSLIWDKLYCFLVVRVRYWVYSAHLSLWSGNEEEIAGDIVQDAIIGTLRYARLYSLWMRDKEVVLPKSLLRLSVALAYQYYEKQERYDSRYVATRLRHFRVQEHLALDELVAWQEMALASAYQEWYCECLVGIIMKIPRNPRKALLVQLANRIHFGSQPARLLLSAFSKRHVCLQDYQQSFPRNPREWNRHRALLQLAYRQIVKQQKQEHDTYILRSQNPVYADTTEADDEESDPVLAALIARLKATAPRLRPDLAFRERLRDELLDMFVEYQVSRKETAHALQIVDLPALPVQQAEAESDDKSSQQAVPALFRSPNAETEDSAEDDETDETEDSELMILAEYLRAKTPQATIDPVFRATLREKLKEIPLMYVTAQTTRTADTVLEETERVLEHWSAESCLLSDESPFLT